MSSNRQFRSATEGIAELLQYAAVLLCSFCIYVTWPERALFFAGAVFVYLCWRRWKDKQPDEEPSLSGLLSGRTPLSSGGPDTEDPERWWSSTVAGATLLACFSIGAAIRGEGIEYWLCFGSAILLILKLFVFDLIRAKGEAGTTAWFFKILAENLFELLLIFTIVAAMYAVVSTYLRIEAETNLPYASLKRWDDSLLYTYEFLKGLKFSAMQTVFLCIAFLIIRQLETRFTRGPARITSAAWNIFRLGMKQVARVCLAALFAASFTFLGSDEKDLVPVIRATVRDFAKTYAAYQSAVEQNLQISVKRELIARTWAEWDPRQQESISLSFMRRKRARNLYGDYNKLHELFHAGDANFGAVLKRLSQPLKDTVRTEVAGLPGSSDSTMENVSLTTLRSANDAAQNALKEIREEQPDEPVKTIEEEFSANLMDLGFEQAKTLTPILEDIDAHFPGAGEFLGAVWNAASETFLGKLKDAQRKIEQDGLASEGDGLKDMIENTARALAAEPPVSTIVLKTRQGDAVGEGQLYTFEQNLKDEAHQAELKELADCGRRLTLKRRQLDELHRKLGITTAEDQTLGLESGDDPTGIDVRASDKPSKSPQQEFIKGNRLFSDLAVNVRLLTLFDTEDSYDRRIAELVGKAGPAREGTLREILGSELEKYESRYKTLEAAREFNRGFERLGGPKGVREEVPYEHRRSTPREIPRAIP